MKKLLQITLGTLSIAAILSLQSCDKIASLAPAKDISWDGASTDIVIPASSNTTDQGTMGDTTIACDLDAMIKAQTDNALTSANIQSVKITSITLTLNDGDKDNNFANFEYAGATFNTDANNGSYNPYTIGYIENNPDTYSTTLTPPVTDADQDVKQYFTPKTTFHYALIGKLRRATKKDLHCHIAIKYTINIKATK